jgi:hypothetical protein
MSFFNFLSIRVSLAIIGGILYGFLTYHIIILLDLSPQIALSAAVFVFLLYFGSRLLILFSGIDSTYYSRRQETIPKLPIEKNSFYSTTQWVGKFYHYHDGALFTFLAAISIVFLISSMIDWLGDKPVGNTFRDFWNALISLF